MKQIAKLYWTITFVPPCIWCILQKILKIVKWFHKRHLPYFRGNLALMRQFSIIVCTSKNLVFCQSCFSLVSVISLARSLRDTFAPNTMRDCQNHCNNISFGTAKKPEALELCYCRRRPRRVDPPFSNGFLFTKGYWSVQ